VDGTPTKDWICYAVGEASCYLQYVPPGPQDTAVVLAIEITLLGTARQRPDRPRW
jgi:hypothetical protein